MDLYAAGDLAALGRAYAEIRLFSDYVQKWHSGSPRWLKMAMIALDLPGAAGGLRPPYLMPDQREIDVFAKGLLALGIEEIVARANELGLSRTPPS